MKKKNYDDEVIEDEVDFSSEETREYVFVTIGSEETASIVLDGVVSVLEGCSSHYITDSEGYNITVPAPGIHGGVIVYLVKSYKNQKK